MAVGTATVRGETVAVGTLRWFPVFHDGLMTALCALRAWRVRAVPALQHCFAALDMPFTMSPRIAPSMASRCLRQKEEPGIARLSQGFHAWMFLPARRNAMQRFMVFSVQSDGGQAHSETDYVPSQGRSMLRPYTQASDSNSERR